MGKGRLLLVDDDADLRLIAQLALESEGYAVVPVGDGAAALGRAVAGGFDGILLDVMLPGLDGYEVCRALRSDPRTAATPVILLSARDAEEQGARVAEVGAAGHIVKPFDVFVLGAQVAALLRAPAAA
jgi:DNA-binding response OmpR family regulator